MEVQNDCKKKPSENKVVVITEIDSFVQNLDYEEEGTEIDSFVHNLHYAEDEGKQAVTKFCKEEKVEGETEGALKQTLVCEAPFGKGAAGALRFFKERGALKQTVEDEKKKNKKAFRLLSHKFHGKRPDTNAMKHDYCFRVSCFCCHFKALSFCSSLAIHQVQESHKIQ